jgi:hypothetical protein
LRRGFGAVNHEVMPKIVMLVVALALAFAGRGQAVESFKIIHVDDLAALTAAKPSTVWIYDVNPPSVRAKEGIVPGARLLSSFDSFDVAEDLPPAKDAKLVFYCANTH